MSKDCLECGREVWGVKRDATFCCTACRSAWNNRRMVRGAELYDLWMANNFQRELRPLGLLTTMSNLASAYRDSDKALRGGRRSWNAQGTLDRLPVTFGKDGDKR